MQKPYHYRKKYHKRNRLVIRNNEEIVINNLSKETAVEDFIRAVKEGIFRGYRQFFIKVPDTIAFFPNVVAPITGIIEFYKNTHGIEFVFDRDESELDIVSIFTPSDFHRDGSNVLNHVWTFSSSSQVASLVDAYISELRKMAVFQKGVLDSIEWSLNEVMDNVLQHSNVAMGYVMGQLHSSSEQIAFSVYDYGCGMYNSLQGSEHHPRTPVDAITMAIKESVTRDKSIGQGNGLFGLHSIVQQGVGRMRITSGGGAYLYNYGSIETFPNIPILSKETPSTTVDFQLRYSSDVSLDNALKFHGVPYQLTNLWLESLEDDLGQIVYVVKNHAEGTGTRLSAVRVRNEILNILQTDPKKIVLDFSGVAVISSSFADELIAKLLLQLGLYQFNRVIVLSGLDFSQQNILHRSVVQRMLEDFSGTGNSI